MHSKWDKLNFIPKVSSPVHLDVLPKAVKTYENCFMDIAQGCGEDIAEDLDLDSTSILNVCPILSVY